ncbi:MAG: carboxypeptidase-like regulatory domain-containing protein [Gemmatimonadaceae bacterium]
MTGLPRAAFAMVLAFSLGTQAAVPGSHRVTGVVHDPNAGVRLAGAIVQAVRVADSSAAPQTFTAVADSLGRFVLEGLPDGRYAIGFQHRALEVLNVESPIDAFELGADSTLRINLAVPSGAALRGCCAGRRARRRGMACLRACCCRARRRCRAGL